MTRRLKATDLADLALPEQPAVAPDASQIVYVVRTQDSETDRAMTSLWRVSAGGGGPARITRGSSDTAPAWSPDGSQVAFLRSAANGPAQVWLLPADGGEPEQVTSLPLGAGRPVWSPDGTRIAFAAPVDPVAPEGHDERGRTRRAPEPVLTYRLDYRVDGAGLMTVRTHLYVIAIADGSCQQVTSGNWHAGQPEWSPDGTQLAFTAAIGNDSDLTGRAGAYVVAAAGRFAHPELIGFATGTASALTWTSDGSALLVVARQGSPTAQAGLYRLPTFDAASTEPGELLDLAGPLDRNIVPGGPGSPGHSRS